MNGPPGSEQVISNSPRPTVTPQVKTGMLGAPASNRQPPARSSVRPGAVPASLWLLVPASAPGGPASLPPGAPSLAQPAAAASAAPASAPMKGFSLISERLL